MVFACQACHQVEAIHQRTGNRLIVISPMIEARMRKVAERLRVETYGDSTVGGGVVKETEPGVRTVA